MTSKDASPPLHRRHESTEARAAVAEKYRLFEERLGPQVLILQSSEVFCSQIADWYERGYKDWMILGATFNIVMQTMLAEQGLDLLDGQTGEIAIRIAMDKTRPMRVYAADHFVRPDFEFFMYHCNFQALLRYGFDIRRHRLKAPVVESFLRDRLNYFELDLHHEPLFGIPSGAWPKQ